MQNDTFLMFHTLTILNKKKNLIVYHNIISNLQNNKYMIYQQEL